MPDPNRDNQAALAAAGKNAIADIVTARALLAGGGAKWDGLTPGQRTAIIDGLLTDMSAVIRYVLNLLDAPA